MIIYQIKNNISGKLYVGQTTRSLSERLQEHFKPSNKSCLALKAAIAKYGKQAFSAEILETCSDILEMNKKEIYWIETLNTVAPYGYNLELGGGSTGKASLLTVEKMKRNYTEDPELVAKVSAASKACWARPEYRAAISAKRKATWSTPAYREKMKVAQATSWSGLAGDLRRLKLKSIKWRSKKVTVYQPSGEPFMSFVSVAATKYYGFCSSSVGEACRKGEKTLYRKLLWSFV